MKHFVMPRELKEAIKNTHGRVISMKPGPDRDELVKKRDALLAERDKLAEDFKNNGSKA